MNILSQPPKDQAMVPNEDDRQAHYVAPPADVESTDVGYVIEPLIPPYALIWPSEDSGENDPRSSSTGPSISFYTSGRS
jgi:hypothetical protein